jgi:hypothetical protein
VACNLPSSFFFCSVLEQFELFILNEQSRLELLHHIQILF